MIKLCVWAASGLLFASIVHSADAQELGNFVLGSSLNAAQQHARQKGWRLVPSAEELPGQWRVDGANLSLFVCGDIVASVTEHLDGDLEEFSALVFSMEGQLGKPDTQILSFTSAAGIISTIDARFVTEDGGATVQLQSVDGKRTFSVNRWIESGCR